MAKKLWDKGLPLDEKIEAFTIGRDNEWDLRLAPYDVQGSIAHVKMLAKVGLLSEQECDTLVFELTRILDEDIKTGQFQISKGVEDIHSQIELMLTEKLGDLGKKIHAGRSRNDQVLLDLKLYFRDELYSIAKQVRELFKALLAQSETHKEVLMPGYTHTQAAMPSSFGLWFAAYAEALVDDIQQLHASYELVNQNPLGSAAGYGSSFPLDRDYTTELLEFNGMNVNVVYAQMGRGKVEQSISFSLAALGQTINKLSSDICLFNSGNFAFITLPDELTTGSSIMPHKKNPDVFELMRAKSAVLRALPASIAQLNGNLTSGYHRDFQLLKDLIFPALDEVKAMLDMCIYAMPKIKPVANLLDHSQYDVLFSVERVNELVMSGLSFRDAYIQVGKELSNGSFAPPKNLNHRLVGSLGNLGNERIAKKMNVLMQSFDGKVSLR